MARTAQLPADALKHCPYCSRRRGNVKAGWVPVIIAGQVQGYTCPACPTWAEPIRPTARGRFVAVFSYTANNRARQLKRTFDALDDARGWLDEQRRGARRHGSAYSDASRLTVDQLCERWLDYQKGRVGPGGIREVTYKGYSSALFSLRAIIGTRPAREVTRREIELALLRMVNEDGKAHRTCVYALATLRQVFAHAVENGWMPSSPATDARAPKEDTNAPTKRTGARRWTVAELVTFRAHVDELASAGAFAAEPWIPVGMRLTLCGLRRSEILGLDWANVDRAQGSVKVAASRVKTGRGHATAIGSPKKENSARTVQVEAIHPGTVQALRAL